MTSGRGLGEAPIQVIDMERWPGTTPKPVQIQFSLIPPFANWSQTLPEKYFLRESREPKKARRFRPPSDLMLEF